MEEVCVWRYPLCPHEYVNFFKPFHFTAGDQLVVPIGASHISLRLQEIQSRGWEKKEQTNNMLGLTQVQKGSYVTLCICRLTLAWISCKNSTTLVECQPILTGLHSLVLTLSCRLVSLLSGVDWSLASPFANSFFNSLSPTLFSCFLTHFRSPEILSPNLFVWFRIKTDKGIVCLVDHLYSVTCGPQEDNAEKINLICYESILISLWTFQSTPYLF